MMTALHADRLMLHILVTFVWALWLSLLSEDIVAAGRTQRQYEATRTPLPRFYGTYRLAMMFLMLYSFLAYAWYWYRVWTTPNFPV
jgi:hypothetical protein